MDYGLAKMISINIELNAVGHRTKNSDRTKNENCFVSKTTHNTITVNQSSTKTDCVSFGFQIFNSIEWQFGDTRLTKRPKKCAERIENAYTVCVFSRLLTMNASVFDENVYSQYSNRLVRSSEDWISDWTHWNTVRSATSFGAIEPTLIRT